MSVLLSEEEHAKSKPSTTSSTVSVGASSIGGLVTEGRGQGGGAKRQSVAEADVLYTISTGTSYIMRHCIEPVHCMYTLIYL